MLTAILTDHTHSVVYKQTTEIQRFELNGISMDGIPLTSGSFNAQGTVFAYAFSYDWTKGVAGQTDPPPRGIGFYCPAVS